MPDVDVQLRHYWSGVAADHPLPGVADLMEPRDVPELDLFQVHRTRRRVLLVAAAAVVVLVIAVGWLIESGRENAETEVVDQVEVDEPATNHEPAVGVGEIEAVITFGEPVNAGLIDKTRVLTPEGDLWMLGQGLALRLDPSSGSVERYPMEIDGSHAIQMPVLESAAVLVGDSIYVADGFGGLTQLDRRDQTITHHDPGVCSATSACELEVAGGAIWVADPSAERDAAVVRVDPSTGTVTDRLDVDPGSRITAMARTDDGALWAAQSGSDRGGEAHTVILTRVDPDDRAVTDSLTADLAPDEASGVYVRGWRDIELISGDGRLWAVSGSGVVLIDTANREVVSVVDTPGIRIGTPVVGDGGLWVLTTGARTTTRDPLNPDAPPDNPFAFAYEGRVVRVDLETGRITDEIELGGTFSVPGQRFHDVLVADSGIWMIDQAPDSLLIRVDIVDRGLSHRTPLSDIGLGIKPLDSELGPYRYEWFAANGSIWVSDRGDNRPAEITGGSTMTRLAPTRARSARARSTRRVRLGRRPGRGERLLRRHVVPLRRSGRVRCRHRGDISRAQLDLCQ